MRIACWVNKATNRHSEYVILTAFSLQKWLLDPPSMLRYSTLPVLLYTYTRVIQNLKKQNGWEGEINHRCEFGSTVVSRTLPFSFVFAFKVTSGRSEV